MSEKIEVMHGLTCLADKSDYCCQRVNLCLADVWYLNKFKENLRLTEAKHYPTAALGFLCEGKLKVVVLPLKLAGPIGLQVPINTSDTCVMFSWFVFLSVGE